MEASQLLRYAEFPSLQERRETLLARRVCILADLTEVLEGLNATAPVSQLPDELLVEIFAHFIVNSDNYEETRPWRSMMEVCHRWRVIIRSTPLFWRRISVGRNSNWLTLCLERCGSAPLVHISFHEPTFPHYVLPPMLSAHAGAIRSLSFLAADWQWEASLTALFTLYMPALEDVVVANRNLSQLSNALQVSGTQLPGLQSFTLSGFPVSEHVALCPKLRRIDLRSTPMPMGLRKLFSDMQANTQLHEVLISDSYNEVPEMLQIPMPTAPPLDLTKVETFRLHSGARPVLQQILYDLRTPNATDISISGVVRGPQDVPGNTLFVSRLLPGPRMPLDIIPALATPTTVCLKVDGRGAVVLEAWNSARRIHLAVADQSNWLVGWKHLLHLCVNDIVRLFAGAPVKNITVNSDHQHRTRSEMWCRLFSAFPDLETLTLSGLGQYSDMWDGLMEASMTRTAPEMSCHRLKVVDLDHIQLNPQRSLDAQFQAIFKVLRYRAMHGCKLETLRMRIKLNDQEDDQALRRTYFPALCTSVDTIVYYNY